MQLWWVSLSRYTCEKHAEGGHIGVAIVDAADRTEAIIKTQALAGDLLLDAGPTLNVVAIPAPEPMSPEAQAETAKIGVNRFRTRQEMAELGYKPRMI